MNAIRIVIVDDDFLIQAYLTEIVTGLGCTVVDTAATAADALTAARAHLPDVVLMDVRLGGKPDGVDAAEEISAIVGTPVIFITGSVDPSTLTRMAALKPLAVLPKPILPDHLGRALARCHVAT